MENRPETGEILPAEEKKRNAGQFQPGQSGNPSGRPKKTEEEKEALEQIRALAPKAVEQLAAILNSNTASLYAKLQAIDIVLNRTYGRPDAALKLETSQQSMEASSERIAAVVQAIREKRGMVS